MRKETLLLSPAMVIRPSRMQNGQDCESRGPRWAWLGSDGVVAASPWSIAKLRGGSRKRSPGSGLAVIWLLRFEDLSRAPPTAVIGRRQKTSLGMYQWQIWAWQLQSGAMHAAPR